MTAALLAGLALPGIVGGASGETLARGRHSDDATTTTLHVPAGFLLLGRMAGGSFVLEAAPASDLRARGGATPGTIECHNDVLTQPDPAGGYLISSYSVAPNPLAPATRNSASQGACDSAGSGGDWHVGPITFLQFQTAGDWGGAISLYGCDAEGACGDYWIDCSPAAVGIGAGAGGVFLTTLQVQDSICIVEQHGTQPSGYVSWQGAVHNWNVAAGSTYLSIN